MCKRMSCSMRFINQINRSCLRLIKFYSCWSQKKEDDIWEKGGGVNPTSPIEDDSDFEMVDSHS